MYAPSRRRSVSVYDLFSSHLVLSQSRSPLCIIPLVHHVFDLLRTATAKDDDYSIETICFNV
jgi:hypothetical protein